MKTDLSGMTPADVLAMKADEALTPDEEVRARAEADAIIHADGVQSEAQALMTASEGALKLVAADHTVAMMIRNYARMLVDEDLDPMKMRLIMADLWDRAYGTAPRSQEITITQESQLPLLSPDQTRLEQPKTTKKATRKRASRRKAA